MTSPEDDPFPQQAAAVDALVAGVSETDPMMRFRALISASARLVQHTAYERIAHRNDAVAIRLLRIAAEIEQLAAPDRNPPGFGNPRPPFRRP